jgi:hypothetical protein
MRPVPHASDGVVDLLMLRGEGLASLLFPVHRIRVDGIIIVASRGRPAPEGGRELAATHSGNSSPLNTSLCQQLNSRGIDYILAWMRGLSAVVGVVSTSQRA